MIMTDSLVFDTNCSHLLIGGYKGRRKEGLGIRGGPRFQSAGKQDKELRSALGYVVSGDAIVGVEELWESINVS